jgi:hypothetical protein
VIRPAFRQALVNRLTILRIIWIALAVSVFVYVGLGVWLTRTMKPAFSSDIIATLTPALYAIAVATALLVVWWRRALVPERLFAATATVSTPTMNVGAAPESDEERRAVAMVARLQGQSVLLWALCESLALYGLVLSIGSGDARHVTGLAAASLVLLGMHAPSRGQIEGAIAAVPRR